MFFCYLLIIFAIIPSISVCLCAPSPVNATFCQADWVSRVYVNSTELLIEKHIRQYTVTHLEVFKYPSNATRELSPEIRTAPFDSFCGVMLELGGDNEFLLSGKESNGTLTMEICDQIVPKPKNVELKWEKYPVNFTETLESIECD
ncbi:unnamed protein product, partial [Mesorhabditis belari]|uniref:NTR domain-containing protein n=1 Tax=Mesorhabditis belari TaxID=2138241 RepID=A0AAF3FAV0_9BILA